LKWAVYGKKKISEPYSIFYFDFDYVVDAHKAVMLEESKDLPLRNRNFTEISNLLVQRDMSLFLISRPNGMGYCDIIASSKKGSITIVPKSISHFQVSFDSIINDLISS